MQTSGLGTVVQDTMPCRSPCARVPAATCCSRRAAFAGQHQCHAQASQRLLPQQQRQVAGQPIRQQLAARRRTLRLRAAVADAEAAVDETYEVFLEKPYGLKFARGNDGAAYILKSDSRAGNTDERIEPGDKIVQVSASFGDDVWDAKNFGQVIYAIKTRNGGLYLKLQKRNGDMSILEEEEMTDEERIFKQERAGGNYGFGTKELQTKNWEKRQQAEKEREKLFESALKKFGAKDTEGALIEFENVLAMEPKNYVGDNFSRITEIYRVTQYNIACCYAAMGSVDAGIDALSDALASGFDQYKVVREDPNLAKLREDARFTKLIDEYDEQVFNSGALKALKSIFPFRK